MRIVQRKVGRSLAMISVALAVLLLTFQSALAAKNGQIVDPPLVTEAQETSTLTSIFTPTLISTSTATATSNLLINGNMDNDSGNWPYYFRPTNHFVAGMWYEWFVTGVHVIPEFIDGGSPYHQACYPVPSDKNCATANNHSQGYILWSSKPFVAGIYQTVTVTPCQMYQFQAFARNDESDYLSKVGIDPYGTGLPAYIPPDGDTLPKNCPPDGKSACPNPGVSSAAALPSTITWSAATSAQNLTWMTHTIASEALSTTISVWTYTDSVPGGAEPQSAYWDMATLTTTTYPDNRLPAPASWTASTFITNVVVAKSSGMITVTWKTTAAAIGQVWYERVRPTAVTTPTTAAYTQYFPMVMQNYVLYPFETTPDATPLTNHRAVFSDLKSGDRLTLVVMSRHFATNTCKTEVYGPLYVTVP